MKDTMKHASVLSAAGALALCLASPAQAEVVAMDDSDLNKITGKAHVTAFISKSSTTLAMAPNVVESDGSLAISGSIGSDSDANQQIGTYQWMDNHATDLSNHKGANDQSGTTSGVQQNVVATTNAITWGALGSNSNVAGTVSGLATQETDTRASLFIGGF